MPDDPAQKAEEYRRIAATLRGIAGQIRYDLGRRDQLHALADGFERFAARLDALASAVD